MLSNWNVLTNQSTSSLQPFIAEKAITFNQGMIVHWCHHFFHISHMWHGDSRCSMANVRLSQGLCSSSLDRHGFVQVTLAALNTSWHFGGSGSPVSKSCVSLSWEISPPTPGGWSKWRQMEKSTPRWSGDTEKRERKQWAVFSHLVTMHRKHSGFERLLFPVIDRQHTGETKLTGTFIRKVTSI